MYLLLHSIFVCINEYIDICYIPTGLSNMRGCALLLWSIILDFSFYTNCVSCLNSMPSVKHIVENYRFIEMLWIRHWKVVKCGLYKARPQMKFNRFTYVYTTCYYSCFVIGNSGNDLTDAIPSTFNVCYF